MLAIFRTNQILASILLLVYALLLWWPLFVWPEAWPVAFPQEGWGLWGDAFAAWTAAWPWWLHRLAAGVVWLVLAGVLCGLAIGHRLDTPGTLFPGVAFFLLGSSLPALIAMHPLVPVAVLLVVVLLLVWQSYQAWQADELLFFTGFWIAVGALFFAPFLWLAGWAVWSLLIMRKLTFRELMVLASGLVTPFWLLWVWYFWHDQQYLFWQQWPGAHLWPRTTPWLTISAWWPWLVAWLLVALVPVFGFGALRLRRTMPVQKKLRVLLILQIFLFAMAVLYLGDYGLWVLFPLTIPLSLFWGLMLLAMPSGLASGLHWLAVLAILGSLLYPVVR